MRRVVPQPLALVQRLVDEPDLALLQVAQAAVDELRRLRRRARGEVVALDQRGAQTAGGGVERGAGAGDAAADDQHVEVGRRPADAGQSARSKHEADARVSSSEARESTMARPRAADRPSECSLSGSHSQSTTVADCVARR